MGDTIIICNFYITNEAPTLWHRRLLLRRLFVSAFSNYLCRDAWL